MSDRIFDDKTWDDRLVLVDKKTRQEIKHGDEVQTFRGETRTIVQMYPPGTSGGGMTGKVLLKDDKGKEYYFNVSVINAEYATKAQHMDSPLDDERPKFGFDRSMAKEKGYDE